MGHGGNELTNAKYLIELPNHWEILSKITRNNGKNVLMEERVQGA